MNQKQYHSLEELPLIMNIADVAAVLGISRAGAYKLAHDKRFSAHFAGCLAFLRIFVYNVLYCVEYYPCGGAG